MFLYWSMGMMMGEMSRPERMLSLIHILLVVSDEKVGDKEIQII